MSKCVTSEHWCEIWNLIHEVVDYHEPRLKRGAAVGWKAGARRHKPRGIKQISAPGATLEGSKDKENSMFSNESGR